MRDAPNGCERTRRAPTFTHHPLSLVMKGIIFNLLEEVVTQRREQWIPGAFAVSRIQISVIDNGAGISAEHSARIFEHGFTTRKDGHGFGLHSSALAAREMGGSLTAFSAGEFQGATFTLDLPLSH
jgi:signal transduction histidine kinase